MPVLCLWFRRPAGHADMRTPTDMRTPAGPAGHADTSKTCRHQQDLQTYRFLQDLREMQDMQTPADMQDHAGPAGRADTFLLRVVLYIRSLLRVILRTRYLLKRVFPQGGYRNNLVVIIRMYRMR